MKKIVFLISLFVLTSFYGHPLLANNLNLSDGFTHKSSYKHSAKQVSSPTRAFDAVKAIESSGFFNNVQDIRIDGISSSCFANIIRFENMRILSDNADFNDLVTLYFSMDAKTFQLIPVDYEIIKDVGIFYNQIYDLELFAKDVNSNIKFIGPSGERFETDELITINSATKDDIYLMKLELGMVLTIRCCSLSDNMTIEIEDPDGGFFSNIDMMKTTKCQDRFNTPVLKSGDYKCRFISKNNNDVSFKMSLINGNCNSTGRITFPLSGSLSEFEYAKYYLTLNKGDYIYISDSSEILYVLIDSKSSLIDKGKGIINTRVNSTDDYYLFVCYNLQTDEINKTIDYNGNIVISPDPDNKKYPKLSKIEDQSIEANNPFSLQLEASSTVPIQYIILPNPAYLTIDKNGLISGTPEIPGVFKLSVIVSNDYGSDQDDFLLTIIGKDDHCDISDSDKDGVIDSIDLCNDTPINSCVNSDGCTCAPVLLETNDYVSKNSWRNYTVRVDSEYTHLNVDLYNLEQDLDLYVRKVENPSLDKFDCRPFKGGKRPESCNLINEGENIWYLGVYGYIEGNFSIKVTADKK